MNWPTRRNDVVIARALHACAVAATAMVPARSATGQRQTEPARITPSAAAARIVAGSAIPAIYRTLLEAALTNLASPQTTRVGTYPSDLSCAAARTETRLVDLDRDTIPEVVLRMTTWCDGSEIERSQPQWLLARDPASGTWSVVAEEHTGFSTLSSRTRGHVDLVTYAGTSVTYWRWDGRRYRTCMVSNFTGNTCTGWRPGKETGDSLATFRAPRASLRPSPAAVAPADGSVPEAALRTARALVAPLGLSERLTRGLTDAVARITVPPDTGVPEKIRCQYTAVAARLVTLNDDATPEVEVQADPTCPTVGGIAHWLFVQNARTGAWALALDEAGPWRALDTRAGGYRDVVLPARSSGWMPVYRWIGDGYAPYCNIVPADLMVSDRPCPRTMRRASPGSRLPAFSARPGVAGRR